MYHRLVQSELKSMNIYRIAGGAYVRTRAALPPNMAVLVDPDDIIEMKKAQDYFRACGLAPR